MKDTVLAVGFVPLVDAAPLVIAHEMGFAAEEGIALDLRRAPSWSSLRDMLAYGQVDAAQMLSGVPVAAAMGQVKLPSEICGVQVMSVNGNVFGVSRALGNQLRAAGFRFDFTDAKAAGQALLALNTEPLRIGVPFPTSMHAELVHYWLSACGAPAGAIKIITVPPPLMPDAMAEGEINAFCVGEPWGSRIVDTGVGDLLLPGSAIWAFSPEKVLAVRTDWAETEQNLLGRLIRAVWRAGRWLAQDGSNMLAAELLSRPAYLNLPPEVLDRALTGRLVINNAGDERSVPRFVAFYEGAASFPWRSQAEWIARHQALRFDLDPSAINQAVQKAFRPDLFRIAMRSASADLPGASAKLEGTLIEDTPVASAQGKLSLCRDAFFDGRIFEPSAES